MQDAKGLIIQTLLPLEDTGLLPSFNTISQHKLQSKLGKKGGMILSTDKRWICLKYKAELSLLQKPELELT